jgi:uncharacterized protein YndB with AHSA1/START domain
MTVVSVHKDVQAATMTMVSAFDATPEQVWQLWADPRLLERWWGPPTWPATVTHHDLVPGGRIDYVMTGPDGETSGGLMQVVSVEPPHTLAVVDSFANADGTPDHSMPTTTMRLEIVAAESGGTRMTVHSAFGSAEVMEQLLGMGMEEGMVAAAGQMDALLAA